MRYTLLVFAVLVSAVSAQGNESQQLQRFQGRWQLISFGGFTADAGDGIVFTGNKYEEYFDFGKDVTTRGTIKLNVSKTPMWIDMKIDEGMDEGKTRLGLVIMSDDSMTMSLADAEDKDRPKTMSSNTMIYKKIR